MSIVARVSSAWGAEIDDDGKIVWFVPQREPAYGAGVQGTITEAPNVTREDPPAVPDPVEVCLLGLPLPVMKDNRQHLRKLRRELRLLALGHEQSYPLAASLSAFFADLDTVFWRGLRDDRGSRPRCSTATPASTSPSRFLCSIGAHFARFIEVLRPRRRVLPPGAAADPGPDPGAGLLPELDVRGVRLLQTSGAEPARWRGPAGVSRQQIVS